MLSTRTSRLFVRAAGSLSSLALCSACMMQGQEAPALTGPSGPGLSLSMQASPSTLARDPGVQATVTVTTRDFSGAVAPGIRLVANVSPKETVLSTVNLTTGSDGTATFVVNSVAPAVVAPKDNQIVISLTPVDSPIVGDFQNASSKSVSIGLLGLRNATYPTPSFTYSPASPKAGGNVVFDASASTDEGEPCPDTCRFVWTITGGFPQLEGRVVVQQFPAEGSFAVTLKVIDQTGAAAESTQIVDVAEAK